MKIHSAEFIISAVKRSDYPKDGLPEIALIGRSNVGKSSLINTFVNRKHLAKTSSQPGKTQTINFYRVNKSFYIVDLPGFGYAKVPMAVKKTWEGMIAEYMDGRQTIRGAFLILDARRDAAEQEEDILRWVSGLGIAPAVVLTKIDKLSKNQLSSRLSALRKAIGVKDPVLFSAVTGEGRVALGKKISGLTAEPEAPA